MGERHSKHRKRVGAGKRSGCLVSLIICLLLCATVAPFILDYLYGKGLLREIWKNSFPAEVWFSFIGSYFPAMIIGILSLCQAYIIYYQDKLYKVLMSRHRFHLINHANIYRYADSGMRIGKYTFQEMKRMLEWADRENLLDVWNECVIAEFDIYSSTDIEISKVQVKKVRWEIAGQLYTQKDFSQMMVAVTRTARSQQQICILFRVNESGRIKRGIEECFLYEFRRNISYKTSTLTTILEITDEECDVCELELEFRLRSTNDNYRMESIEEHYYAM